MGLLVGFAKVFASGRVVPQTLAVWLLVGFATPAQDPAAGALIL